MTTDNQATNTFGKYFIWIAWFLGLALLAFVFQELLEQQWNPNQEPSAYFNSAGKAEVALQQNRQGHYLVRGAINEQDVTFLLDTGATHVSIPAHIAANLHLPELGQYRASTANGDVIVTETRLKQLSIGKILLYNVAANINPGMKSDEILLGMSALKRVEFSQMGKQLILRERN